jgi:hypothetical protein
LVDPILQRLLKEEIKIALIFFRVTTKISFKELFFRVMLEMHVRRPTAAPQALVVVHSCVEKKDTALILYVGETNKYITFIY